MTNSAQNHLFVFMSTNKVYGDRPNTLPLVELESRWEYAEEDLQFGINESLPIDQSTLSIFGVSQVLRRNLMDFQGPLFQDANLLSSGCRCLTGPDVLVLNDTGFSVIS